MTHRFVNQIRSDDYFVVVVVFVCLFVCARCSNVQGLFSFVGAVSAVVLAEPPTKNENDVKPNGSIYRTKEK